jgi:hypothetical protein
MRGTRPTTKLSWGQSLLIASAWIAGLLGLVLLAPQIANQTLAAVLGLGVLGACWTVTIRITQRPAGRMRMQITSYEGLRGSFAVHQLGWYVLLVPAISLTAVGVQLLRETPHLAARPSSWVIAALVALLVIGGPLAMIVGRVRAFRVDDDGQLWVRRWGRYVPLRLAEFGQVRGHVVQARGAIIPTRVVCASGAGRLRRVVFTLDHIASRDYHTPVPAGVLDAFLQDACERAGLTVRSLEPRGSGWVATVPKGRA